MFTVMMLAITAGILPMIARTLLRIRSMIAEPFRISQRQVASRGPGLFAD
ncbi:MAG: hypothetical protein ACLQDM_28370 [Bradyrhizobium sp.]